MTASSTIRRAALAGAAVAALAMPQAAQAVPSYARQTGLACEACHTVFPELTRFGRVFKASGYTLFNTAKVEDISNSQQSILSLSNLPPISMMIVASSSFAAKALDPNSASSSTDFPQQLSIFYGGRISDNIGAFVQATYDDQSGTFGMDNLDVRFADVTQIGTHSLIYGVSLNNNPSVQDLWNTAPAWSQPFMASPVMQTGAATQLEGAMAQVVAGLSAYAFLDESFYGEFGVYRSALQGASVASSGNTTNNIIDGVTPYWRFAYENDWDKSSLEFGTFGLAANLANPTTPGGNAVNLSLQHALTDRFVDVGADAEYQYVDDARQITITGRWLHEDQTLDASFNNGFSDNRSNHLDTISANAGYFWHRQLGGTIGFYNSFGSKDATYYGSINGKPDSSWGTVEVDYLPWLNVKLGLQYTAYFKFNGATNNYDGAGRNASDNNLLYGYLWVAY